MKLLREWKKIFYDEYTLMVHREVYEPAEDSFLIADNLKFDPGKKVLDMGTGCGILAIKAAGIGCEVVAVDISPYATSCTKKNVESCGFEEKVHIVRGDLFKPIRKKEYFDAIVFNPPYLPTESCWYGGWLERSWDGGFTGRGVIERFIDEAGNYLKHNGEILIVQSTLSNVEETLRKFRSTRFITEVVDKADLDFESLILIKARKVGDQSNLLSGFSQ
ncbi:MAG: class I SAM-dependent methyltransferase [Candidatus Bathyarchaeia archaeon]